MGRRNSAKTQSPVPGATHRAIPTQTLQSPSDRQDGALHLKVRIALPHAKVLPHPYAPPAPPSPGRCGAASSLTSIPIFSSRGPRRGGQDHIVVQAQAQGNRHHNSYHWVQHRVRPAPKPPHKSSHLPWVLHPPPRLNPPSCPTSGRSPTATSLSRCGMSVRPPFFPHLPPSLAPGGASRRPRAPTVRRGAGEDQGTVEALLPRVKRRHLHD